MAQARHQATQPAWAMFAFCFLACGDAEMRSPTPNCEDHLQWEGDFLVETPAHLAELAPYSEIAGNLTITGDVLDVGALGCLERVGGLLYLSQGQLETLSGFSRLTEVGSLYVSEMPNLRSFEGLEEIAALGSLTVQLSGVQSFVGLSAVESIAGRVHIYRSSMPDFGGLESLVSVGGNFTITGYTDTLTLDGLESLASIGGSLDVQLNNGLASMEGLSALQRIGGELRVVNNAALAELGLSQLSELGSTLQVTSNPSLPNCQALALRDRLVIGGWKGNEAIESNSPASCD